MNNGLERIWKEEVVVNLRYYPGICLEELRKITRNLRQDSLSTDRDLNPEFLNIKQVTLLYI
jgi:hypothetical protein